MGYLYKGTCFASLPDARASACSETQAFYIASSVQTTNSSPSTPGIGNSNTSSNTSITSVPTFVNCTTSNFNDSFMSLTYTTASTLNTSTTTWPSLPSCSYDAADYSSGWFAAAFLLLLIAYSGRQLFNLFNAHHDRD